MYEFRGFTQKANKALNLSIESAQNFGHDYIGTEHILLGLIKEGSGVAAAALEECGVTAEALEKEIANVDGRGIQTSLSPDSFTPRTKRVLRTAMMISARTGSSYVGTEHILLAIVSESDSYATSILRKLGVSSNAVANAERLIRKSVFGYGKRIPTRQRGGRLRTREIRQRFDKGCQER